MKGERMCENELRLGSSITVLAQARQALFMALFTHSEKAYGKLQSTQAHPNPTNQEVVNWIE